MRTMWRRGIYGVLALLLGVGAALAAGSVGSLDTDFDGDGVALLSTGEAARFYAVAEQADGKLVVIGRDARSVELDPAAITGWKVRRYFADGSLDANFGTNGVATLFGEGEDWREDEPLDVAIDSQGRIVIVGRVFTSASSGGKKGKKGGGGANPVGRATVARLTSGGQLDSSFGDGGVVQQDFADNQSGPIANSVLVDENDGIVVGGFADMPYDVEVQWRGKKTRIVSRLFTRSFLIRYDEDGALATSFGDGGVLIDEDTYDGTVLRHERMLGDTLRFQSDGSLVAAIWSRPNDSSSVEVSVHQVRRYSDLGDRDLAFSAEEPGTHLVSGLAVDGQDRIVLAMNDYPAPYAYQAALVARYEADGDLDTTFGDSGYSALEVNATGDLYAACVATDASDRVILGLARLQQITDTTYDALTARLDSNGDLDATYGTGGLGGALFPSDIGTAYELAYDLLIDALGNPVAVGSKGGATPGYAAWIARWCGS